MNLEVLDPQNKYAFVSNRRSCSQKLEIIFKWFLNWVRKYGLIYYGSDSERCEGFVKTLMNLLISWKKGSF
jgi:hypothetical protein